jgi:HlyD family secretion protein
MFKKVAITVIVVAVLAVILFFAFSGNASNTNGLRTVEVTRGEIIDKALAVGRIEPKKEIAVKSKISGLAKKIFADVGDLVKEGDPLIDVAPDPTPIEFAKATRNVEIYEVAFENAKREYDRAKVLLEKEMIHEQEYDRKMADFDQARLRLRLAREELELIESGRTQIADLKVTNIVKSPIDGMVLTRLVEEGDPVVPLTSYQAGTELMTLAYMEDLIFKGTVDEIDVGKIRPGMECEIKIGALPKDTIYGVVQKISPKAHREEGSTVFDVEIELTDIGTDLLRAGYSANADIIIAKKTDILMIPERLIEFKEDTAFVEVSIDSSNTEIDTIQIETGLSDGINIEVLAGLDEGELVVERPPREIQ